MRLQWIARFASTPGLMAVQRVAEIKLFAAMFAVVHERFGEMFGLYVVLYVVFGLVGEGPTDGAEPGVGAKLLAPLDIIVEVAGSSQEA